MRSNEKSAFLEEKTMVKSPISKPNERMMYLGTNKLSIIEELCTHNDRTSVNKNIIHSILEIETVCDKINSFCLVFIILTDKKE